MANANRLHDENLLKESNLSELIRFDQNKQIDFQPFTRAIQTFKTLDCQKRLLERMISLTLIGKLTAENVEEILLACEKDARNNELKSHLIG